MKINIHHLILLTILFLINTAHSQEQATSEGFDDITDLPGWVFENLSEPLGDSNWFQGKVVLFTALNGDPNSYIAANHRNTLGTSEANGVICNFMIMPNLGLLESISFWSRSTPASNNVNIYPDRLYLLYSPTGEINTGNCTDGFGDFTETLVEINPNLSGENFPEGYPLLNWEKFSAEINGEGRLAFVYYVTEAGFFGENSNYIGIDNIEWVFGAEPPTQFIFSAGFE